MKGILKPYIHIHIKCRKILDSQSILFHKNLNEMQDEADSLVAHRKQTCSSGNQILFQAWHIKGKSQRLKMSFQATENVGHKPSSFQTNKIERSEVKLAVNVWSPIYRPLTTRKNCRLIFPQTYQVLC